MTNNVRESTAPSKTPYIPHGTHREEWLPQSRVPKPKQAPYPFSVPQITHLVPNNQNLLLLELQWNLVITRSDTTKSPHNEATPLAPAPYTSLFFHPDILRNPTQQGNPHGPKDLAIKRFHCTNKLHFPKLLSFTL